MPTRLLCLGGLLAIASLYFAVHPIGFDPNSACVSNARMLSLALQEYSHDYDESLPPMQTAPKFQSALEPYITQPARFYCPATGKAYRPTTHVSYENLASFAVPYDVITFQDDAPHSNGLKMVCYLDGHVEFGGVTQGDPTQQCISNARELALVLNMYSQDYDERFPPMTKPADFRTAVYPYMKSPEVFRCPVTGAGYAPNLSLSEEVLSEIADPHTKIVVQDAVQHPDGLRTISYLDGHAVHGDLGDVPTDTGNLAAIGLAFVQFEQDNDENLPPMSSYPSFKSALTPYAANQPIFTSPQTGLAYAINTSLNGDHESQISYPASTPVAWDEQVNSDGTVDTVYADGHVGTQYYAVASQLTAGPATGNPAVVWQTADGLAAIDDLSSDGATVKEVAYTHPTTVTQNQEQSNAKLLGIGVLLYEEDYDEQFPPMDNYADFKAAILPYVGNNSAVFTCPGTGLPYVLDQALNGQNLGDIADTYDTWVFHSPAASADGSFCTEYVDGHIKFDDSAAAPPALLPAPSEFNVLAPPQAAFYTPDLNQVATVRNDERLILWGRSEMWTTDIPGVVSAQSYMGPFDGWSAVAVASGGQARGRLLMQKYDGSLALLTLSAKAAYVSDVRLTADPDETAVGMVVGVDGDTRILFSEPGGGADVWTLSPAGAILQQESYTADSSRQAVGIAIGVNNVVHILWSDRAGSASLWTLGLGSTVTNSIVVTLGPAWTPVDTVIENHGDYLILWKGPAGVARITRVQPSGAVVYNIKLAPRQ